MIRKKYLFCFKIRFSGLSKIDKTISCLVEEVLSALKED